MAWGSKHSLLFLCSDPCAHSGKHTWVCEKAGAHQEDYPVCGWVSKVSPTEAHKTACMRVIPAPRTPAQRTPSPAFTGVETEARAHTWIC